MRITFLGAAGTVTGSSFLLENETNKILVDMGMFQGNAETENLNYAPLHFDPKQIKNVFLTHAHLDHCGRLPLLAKHGFEGKVYMTEATKKLMTIVLLDSANIFEKDFSRPDIYSKEDIEKLVSRIETVVYDKAINIDNYEVVFKDAGHILGSSSIQIRDTKSNKSIVFSGDLGNTPEDIVKPTEYFDHADYVVMESTYGDKVHSNEVPNEVIQKEINTIENSGGTLLIPSFSIEKTQEVLHIIDHLKMENKVKLETKVFLDSPMGEKATIIYKQFEDLYNSEMAEHTKNNDPFSFQGLKIIENAMESKNIKSQQGPKVIIAGSGMMSGGRIANHAIDFLPSNSTRVLIVGFQAVGTPGRAIEVGAKIVEIYGQNIVVKANVTSIHSMSSHADQPKLLNWIGKIKGINKVFLVHGEDEPRKVLAKKIEAKGYCQNIDLPSLYQTFDMI